MAAAQEPVACAARAPLVALALLAAIPATARAGELKNWFGDPFFQVRDAVRDCPVPRGPLMTGDEMRRSAHARTERGTRCWQEGQCARPNAYMYDVAIGDEVRRRFAASRELPASSLWVTVQRRIVFVEGCAASADGARRVEALLRGTGDVEQVVVNIARRPSDRSPYETLKTLSGIARGRRRTLSPANDRRARRAGTAVPQEARWI